MLGWIKMMRTWVGGSFQRIELESVPSADIERWEGKSGASTTISKSAQKPPAVVVRSGKPSPEVIRPDKESVSNFPSANIAPDFQEINMENMMPQETGSIEEFANEVSEEDDIILYGSIKAPKILADIVESLAAAIYFDLNFDLQKLWVIFRDLLEPITTLHEQCQKQGRKVDIKPGREGAKNIAPVYVDGVSIASCSSDQSMDIAVLNAAKQALLKLSKSMTTNLQD
nr:ribonuclease 3-like protein 2 [Quercus suber]